MTDLRIAKDRLLYMYSRLVDGKMLYKKEEAQRFGCSLRSIQRDIEDLRSFLHEQNEASGLVQDLVYNQKLGAYQLVPPSRNLLSNEEVFATLKILLESRAFTKKELYPILDCCIPKTEQQRVSELIGNEKLLYVEPQHKDKFLKKMWELSGAVHEHLEIIINYRRTDGVLVQRRLQPVDHVLRILLLSGRLHYAQGEGRAQIRDRKRSLSDYLPHRQNQQLYRH